MFVEVPSVQLGELHPDLSPEAGRDVGRRFGRWLENKRYVRKGEKGCDTRSDGWQAKEGRG